MASISYFRWLTTETKEKSDKWSLMFKRVDDADSNKIKLC